MAAAHGAAPLSSSSHRGSSTHSRLHSCDHQLHGSMQGEPQSPLLSALRLCALASSNGRAAESHPAAVTGGGSRCATISAHAPYRRHQRQTRQERIGLREAEERKNWAQRGRGACRRGGSGQVWPGLAQLWVRRFWPDSMSFRPLPSRKPS